MIGAVIFRGWIVAFGVLIGLGSSARAAPPFAVAEVHAEADVHDEAGAVTLLVRSALVRTNRTLVAIPLDTTLATAPAALAELGAERGVFLDLSREGTGLRVTIALVAKDGSRSVSFVRAGDGAVGKLAQGVVDKITAALGIENQRVADRPLGPLRPYAAALRQRQRPDDAAAALADATPTTALAVPAASTLLANLPANVTIPARAALAARAIRDVARLDAIGAGGDATAVAARALAAVLRTNARDAEQALGARPPKDPLVAVALVALAETRADNDAFGERIKDALATDLPRPVLAIAAANLAERFAPPIHKALVAFAEKTNVSPGVASRIGLNAAVKGVEVPRALALVSARELDDYDLQRLDPLVVKGTDATALRLRAELAMRRADGTEGVLINEYVKGAPDDPRAQRYLGWQLMGDGKYAAAAAALEKAGVPAEQARALLAANEPRAALAALGRPPASAEEHVIATRVHLADKKLDLAASSILLAERGAPVSPVVHHAILALEAQAPDPARRELARLVVENGSSAGQATLVAVDAAAGSNIAVTTQPVAPAGSGSAAATPVVGAIELDTASLEAMLAALPGLQEIDGRAITLAEIRWEPGLFSFRETYPAKLEAALAKLLSIPPYRLQVVRAPHPLPDAPLDAAKLSQLTTHSDAVLVFRLAPSGDRAHLSLVFYQQGARDAAQVAQVIALRGAIGFNAGKVKAIGVFAAVFLLAFIIYLTRAKGTIKVEVSRAPDISDEVLCIELAKSPTRPLVDDPVAFHRATQKAGAITKQRSATLIASGHAFRVPAGKWYVHLYGAFVRGGNLRVVPASCTQQIQLRRGQVAVASFDLTSKFAELTVEIVTVRKRGAAVWANDNEQQKVYTDGEGEALLQLPLGTHKIHIDAHGHKLERDVQVTALKVMRISINVERELRMMTGIALDLGPEPEPPPMPEVKMRKVSGASPALAAGSGGAGAEGAAANATMPLASAQTQASPELSRPQAKLARATTPSPGDTLLGRYRITAELGRGAMGVVHRAWDEKLEREVAIKEMADDLRANPEALRLFTQEAKALAQLNHTNIVAMYDQITDASGVYMIMEFVDGRPLLSLVEQRGALPWLEAVGIVDQVCAGLAYAHARKVIHRDIKPANIFVANDRTVKLGDFGLARVMREVTIRRTEIRGTPLYMAPEQITGTDVDHRTDLYAIGCTLFELLCGRPPFIDGDILYAQMHVAPPVPSSMTPDVPQALDALVASLLAKKADDRPGSANEVRTTFRQLFEP